MTRAGEDPAVTAPTGARPAARYAAVLAYRRPSTAAPPGVDPDRLRLALLEDSYEVLAALEQVTAALALCPGGQPEAEELTWPGTPILVVTPADGPAETVAALAACAATGATQAAVVAADVPDLPALLLGKLYRGLGSAQVALCPAVDGGLVALAARLPLPGWLVAARAGLDTPDALDRLAAAAPSRRALSMAPGWHRIRRPEDLARLDPGLEGWPSTRLLLNSARSHDAR